MLLGAYDTIRLATLDNIGIHLDPIKIGHIVSEIYDFDCEELRVAVQAVLFVPQMAPLWRNHGPYEVEIGLKMTAVL